MSLSFLASSAFVVVFPASDILLSTVIVPSKSSADTSSTPMPAYAQRFSESQSRPSMRWLPPVLPTLTEVIRLEFLTVREFSPGMFQKPHSTDTYLLTLCHPIPAHLGWGEQGGRMLGRGLTTSAITKLPVILTYSRFESSGQYYRSSTLHNTLQRNVSLCDTLQKLQS